MLFSENLPIKIENNHILLYVKVTPKASKNKIGQVFNNNLKIYVTNLAEAGQANKAVIELLSDSLKINKSNILIVQGLTSSTKIIRLSGDIEQIIKYLKIVISK